MKPRRSRVPSGSISERPRSAIRCSRSSTPGSGSPGTDASWRFSSTRSGPSFEQRSNAVDARWTIATNVPDSRIAIETKSGAEALDAWKLATDVLWDLGFR